MRRMFRAAAALIALALAIVIALPMALTALYAVVDPLPLPVLRRELAGQPVERVVVPLEAVAPALARAVVMNEDARFCLHYGVDLRQLAIVVGDALEGKESRGASTITMQVVKNLFLWPSRSYLRKAIELPLALWMDLVLSKDRILEIYLNTAQWGPAQYGIEAASRHFFARSAADLSASQALALATLLPAPSLRDPRHLSSGQQAIISHIRRELARAPWVFGCLSERIRP